MVRLRNKKTCYIYEAIIFCRRKQSWAHEYYEVITKDAETYYLINHYLYENISSLCRDWEVVK